MWSLEKTTLRDRLLAYKIVMEKFNAVQRILLTKEDTDSKVTELFPEWPENNWEPRMMD